MDANDMLSAQRAVDHHASELDRILQSLPSSEDRDHARGNLEDMLANARKATSTPPAAS